MKSLIAALAGLLLVNSIATAEEKPTAAESELELIQVEEDIIEHTNAQRRRHGLPELRVTKWLVHSARRHAAWMTRSNALVHTRASVAENIAMGQNSSVAAVRAWMTSPGHRANMLNGAFRYVGAAAYRTPSGTNYWCIQFLR